MKKQILFAAAALALAAVCCQKNPSEAPVAEPVMRTFTCTFASAQSDDPTKVAIASDGKTSWEVGDQLMIHGEYTKSPYSQIVTLSAGDISADKKTATFTLPDLTVYDRSGSGYKSNLYIAYPASAVVENDHCYWNTRFSSSNHPLMVGYNNGNVFVLHNICGLITFTVSGDFDTYVLEGKNGETVGYSALQTRIRLNEGGTENLDGFPVRTGTNDSYTTVGTTSVSAAVTADGSTVNMISIPGGADFTSGFTIKFLKSGSVVKTLSTKAVNLEYGKLLPLGDVTSYLKDYVAPTSHPNTIGVDVATATDLGATATANCYIVDGSVAANAGASFKFKAVKGNSATVLSGVTSVSVLWETKNTSTAPSAGDIIASADYDQAAGEDPYIVFKTPATLTPGNALIAAKNAGGDILWSWHIWIPATAITTVTDATVFGSKAIMDRNLGALVAAPSSAAATVESYGLLYEWGRKDPFPGMAGLTTSSAAAVAGTAMTKYSGTLTIDESIAQPTTYAYVANKDWVDAGEQSNTLWTTTKTVYDPCPPGYIVPTRNGSVHFWGSTALNALDASDNFADNGATYYSFQLGTGTAVVFPFAGYIDDSGGSYYKAGVRSLVWSSYASSADKAYGRDSRHDGPSFARSEPARSRGASVRCVAE